jgi:hypothetical protein
MSNLEKLKQQMMIKPDVQERKPVAIFIQTKPPQLSKSIPKSKSTEEEEREEVVNEQTVPPQKLVIVNEIQKGFDRQGLLDKIKQQQMSKVVMKPILEISESKRVIEPTILEPTILEPTVLKPIKKESADKPAKIKKGKLRIKEDVVEIMGEATELPVIQINEPVKRTRLTVKPEKGVAILGPEINVVIGDTLLPKRLHKREPLINIKASSYYMNNREIFVNFINSLFEPYRIELDQNKNSISCDDIGKTSSNFSLLTHQKIVRDYMNLYTPYRGILLYHGLGSGKCLKKDTPIIMYDGIVKPVQDVQVGDLLMGDDSKPRKVLSLARGKDKMYDVIPVKGDKYTVNQEHILCLKAPGFPKLSRKLNTNYNIQWIEHNKFQSKTFTYNASNQQVMNQSAEDFFREILRNSQTNESIMEISIQDYLKLSTKKKNLLKGYKVPIEFAQQDVQIDPYMIGYWLGDGSSSDTKISSQDSSVLKYFADKLQTYNLHLVYSGKNDYRITGNGKCDNNVFRNTLKELNMLDNKHIPMIYKCNSRENRLRLLAGLLDSGSKGGFEFTQKNETLMNDVIFLARSLGFACYKQIRTYKGTKKHGTAFRIHINGAGIEQIPTLIPRKQATYRKHTKDTLVTGIKVQYVNEDDYYGFVIDGNRRFILGDFTVTHNTATSIGIAEGMKSAKRVIILTPASLRANYVEELKKAGDLLYKKNQFWEWISTDGNPELMNTISAVLNLPREYIHKQHGAWFINANKKSNYDSLSDTDRKTLDAQLDVMINEKYTFVNYNGLRSKRLGELTNGFTNNLFDNSVVIIDEAHNLISRIVNKLKKEKPIPEDDRGEKEHLPINLSIKLYEYLLSAKNARVVLLSGTPVINYPNEFGILFNILRGYIKTWHITLNIKTNKKVDRNVLNNILIGEKSHDYLDYSPASKVLTITRNPFGFKNKIKKTGEYKGVSNDTPGFETDFISDEDFEKTILSILHRNDIDVVSSGIKIRNQKALPDDFDQFYNRYIDSTTHTLKNVDALKRRIIGLSSYFRSAQENLLPRYNKTLGVDYHVVRIPMSNFQFKTYESARIQERKSEKSKKAPPPGAELAEPSSTYRIFSRLFCNYVMPNRPLPKDVGLEQSAKSNDIKEAIRKELITQTETQRVNLLAKAANEIDMSKKIDEEINKTVDIIFTEVIKRKTTGDKKPTKSKSKKDKEAGPLEANVLLGIKIDDIENIIERQLSQSDAEEAADSKNNVSALLHDAQRIEAKQDVTNDEEGELEGDEILDEIGGDTYKERILDALRYLQDNSNDYLAPEALQTYSPKFLHMLENIKDPEYKGLHLVYSQFRTLEGIGIFSLVLDKNGFTRFKIKKSTAGVWEMDISESDLGKPTYALYTGTETSEEKEIIRHIYNGEWDQIPDTISKHLEKIANNNNLGEIIKVLMITSSGSEGINLRNTRYVHIMEPYWHPVRLEQVIGRARRICSHKNLPTELQTVEVFVYLMTFTDEQLKSDEAVELKRKDLSRGIPKVPLTSDQNLYEISEIKLNLTSQLTEAIKESAFDCYIYNNGKCVNFADPTTDKFSYVPDYAAQQNDTTTIANKVAIEWVGKPINLAGVDYVYRRMSKDVLNIYDKSSYEGAMKNSSIIPLQIGTVETNERGEKVFRQLVSG